MSRDSGHSSAYPPKATELQAPQPVPSNGSDKNTTGEPAGAEISTEEAQSRFDDETSTTGQWVTTSSAPVSGLMMDTTKAHEVELPQYTSALQKTIDSLKDEITSLKEAKSDDEKVIDGLQKHLLETKTRLASQLRELESTNDQLTTLKGSCVARYIRLYSIDCGSEHAWRRNMDVISGLAVQTYLLKCSMPDADTHSLLIPVHSPDCAYLVPSPVP